MSKNTEPIFIRDWEELSKIPQESETHILKIDLKYGRGRIYSKPDNDYYCYLSTHTFYENDYKGMTEILRMCGFNVTLDNWDKENVE